MDVQVVFFLSARLLLRRAAIFACVLMLGSVQTGLCLGMPRHNERKRVKVGSVTRTYVIHLPRGAAAGPKPLVVMLHGALCNAWTADWNSRMSAKSDKEGFIVVYPVAKGLLHTWNAGTCCAEAMWKNHDDVGFVRDVIEQVCAEHEIDRERVFVAGVSNGAMLAYRIGDALADTVAAIATVDGAMMAPGSRSDAPVSVIAFQGTRDRVVPYMGGVGRFWGYKLRCPSSEETIKYWAERDGCRKIALREEIGGVTKETYAGGANGTDVCRYTINCGHAWPGGRAAMIGSRAAKEISATDVIWDFFKSHPKEHAVRD